MNSEGKIFGNGRAISRDIPTNDRPNWSNIQQGYGTYFTVWVSLAVTLLSIAKSHWIFSAARPLSEGIYSHCCRIAHDWTRDPCCMHAGWWSAFSKAPSILNSCLHTLSRCIDIEVNVKIMKLSMWVRSFFCTLHQCCHFVS